MSEARFGDERLEAFLEALASSESTPGGGSAAAVGAATGAALISMVGRLTEGKDAYESAWKRMAEIVAEADEARAAFLGLADRDTEAFRAVMTAFRLPKETDEQKAGRSAAIQRAFVQAAEVPAEVARRAVGLMDLAVEAVETGNTNATSDGVAAADLLFAGAQAALANVAINAGSIKDAEVAGRLRAEAEELDARSRERLQAAGDAFRRSLASG
jgi:methenyltetrahydrofolate cyclohydrolase